MSFVSTRIFARNIHIFIAILQGIYIYSPIQNWPTVQMIVHWVTFPLLALTGLWLFLGHKVWFKLSG